jgi:hypothetical protein
LINKANANDSNASNYILTTSNNLINKANANDSNASNYILTTSNNLINKANANDSNASNYILTTSNLISKRITDLTTDMITENITAANKFIVNNLYNDDLEINGTLTINSNLIVLGDTTQLDTIVYTTERLEVVNANNTTTAFMVQQKTNNRDIFVASNIDTAVFRIANNGDVHINGDGIYKRNNRDMFLDTSNYILTTSNNLINKANANDSNSSNYILTTSNNLINKANANDSNSSNYILTTSNNLINKANANDSNASNYILSTSNNLINKANANDSNTSNYILTTSNNLINKANANDSNSSNYILTTSNLISKRITDLTTDMITENITATNKFIVNNLYNDDLILNGTLTINSNLIVLGDTTQLDTIVYTTERLEVVNANNTTTAFMVQQKTNNRDIFVASNIDSAVFRIANNGDVHINGNGIYKKNNRDMFLDTSNYILTTSNNLINKANENDSNASNYILTTSNNLINKVKENDNNSSNYILTTSNNLINKANENDSNTSNYILSTSNILSDRLYTLDQLTSNIVNNSISTLNIKVNANDLNASNYILTTSNILSNRLYTLDQLTSNIVNNSISTLNIKVNANDLNTSNYILSTSNILSDRLFTLDQLTSNIVNNSISTLNIKVNANDNNSSNYILSTSNILSDRLFTLDQLTSNIVNNSISTLNIKVNANDQNASNYILKTSNILSDRLYTLDQLTSNIVNNSISTLNIKVNANDQNASNYILTTSNILSDRLYTLDQLTSNIVNNSISTLNIKVNANDSNSSNYVLFTSNIISKRITDLTTDMITENIEAANKFIVNNRYNNNLELNGTLTVNSNLIVLGESTQLDTTVYTTERLEIVNANNTASALMVQQNSPDRDIFIASNIDMAVFKIANNGDVHIYGNGNYKKNNRDVILDTSNYILTTSNNLINKANENNSNTSNYILSTSNILSDRLFTLDQLTSNIVNNSISTLNIKVNANDLNASNYILSTSNILSDRLFTLDQLTSNIVNNSISTLNIKVNENDSNTSNYILSTSNILSDRLFTLDQLTSNIVNNSISTLNIKVNENDSNTSNYILSTSNILSNRLYTLDQLTSNIVNNSISTLNIKVNANDLNASNYILSTSNILSNRLYTLDQLTSNIVNNSISTLNIKVNANDLNASNYVLSTSNILAERINKYSVWTPVEPHGSNIYYYSTGNVGIGTKTPETKLHILDNASSNTKLTIQNKYLSTNSGQALPNEIVVVGATSTIIGTNERCISFPYITDTTGAGQTGYSFTIPENLICDILVIGGGGGGGKRHGGGGGAGTLLYQKNIILNGTYNIKVGKGGLGQPEGETPYSSLVGAAEDGRFSQFIKSDGTQNYYAVGGGRGTGGKGLYVPPPYVYANTNGGQGYNVDPSITLSSDNKLNGVSIPVVNKEYVNTLPSPQGCRGNIGGMGLSIIAVNGHGGGGGGAGSAGITISTNDIYGGLGLAIDITGTSVVYAGGGNGTRWTGNSLQVFNPAYPTIQSRGGGGYGSETGIPENGLNGTGGGGGGQGNDTTGKPSGSGGSGIVIIRYRTANVSSSVSSTVSSVSIEFVRGEAADSNTDYKIGNYNGDFKIMSSTSNIDSNSFVLTSNGNLILGGSLNATSYMLNGSPFSIATEVGYTSNYISDVNSSLINKINELNTSQLNYVLTTSSNLGDGLTTVIYNMNVNDRNISNYVFTTSNRIERRINETTTDKIVEGTKNKFIIDNKFNSNLEINGRLVVNSNLIVNSLATLRNNLDITGDVNFTGELYKNGMVYPNGKTYTGSSSILSQFSPIQTQFTMYKNVVEKTGTGWQFIDNNINVVDDKVQGFCVRIKPNHYSSKILINLNCHIGIDYGSDARWWGLRLYRKIGEAGTWEHITEADGTDYNNNNGTTCWLSHNLGAESSTYSYFIANISGAYYDIPGVSENYIYYTVKWCSLLGDNTQNGKLYLNRPAVINSLNTPIVSSSWNISEIWQLETSYFPKGGIVTKYTPTQTQFNIYKNVVEKISGGWQFIDNDTSIVNNNIKGFCVRIRPNHYTSKILINLNCHIGIDYGTDARWWGLRLFRRIGETGEWVHITDADGNNGNNYTEGTPCWLSHNLGAESSTYSYLIANVSGAYYDVPNAMDTYVYYTAKWCSQLGDELQNGKLYLNRPATYNSANSAVLSSSWNAQEIWQRETTFIPKNAVICQNMSIQTLFNIYRNIVIKTGYGWQFIDNNINIINEKIQGFCVRIKPTHPSSKVLVHLSCHIGIDYGTDARWWGLRLYRKIGEAGTWEHITDADGTNLIDNKGTTCWLSHNLGAESSTSSYFVANISGSFFDLPGTSSNFVYYTAKWCSILGDDSLEGKIYLNRPATYNDGNSAVLSSSWNAQEIWQLGTPYEPTEYSIINIFNNNNVGIGTTNPVCKLDVNGTINAINYSTISDRRYKKDIREVNSSLELINRLNPVSYLTIEQNEGDKRNYGFIAQDLHDLIPEAVNVPTNESHNYTIDYMLLIPLLTKSIQELTEKINTQQKTIDDLSARLNANDSIL